MLRYWRGTRAEEIEYSAVSFNEQYAVFCFTVAGGQGGVIAVWNACRRRWEHVSNADFVTCAMMLPDLRAVVSFHYVNHYGITPFHAVVVTAVDRTLDGYACVGSSVQELRKGKDHMGTSHELKGGVWRKVSFDQRGGYAVVIPPSIKGALKRGSAPSDDRVETKANGCYDENEYGPLGLFLLKDKKTFLAHDYGNLIEFSFKDVVAVLEKRRKETKKGEAEET